MRLIDADGLFDYLFERQNKAIKEDGERWGLYFDIGLFAISQAPTIEAIPIKWIEKWFSQFYGKQGLEWNRCKRFMLEDWEKERNAGN